MRATIHLARNYPAHVLTGREPTLVRAPLISLPPYSPQRLTRATSIARACYITDLTPRRLSSRPGKYTLGSSDAGAAWILPATRAAHTNGSMARPYARSRGTGMSWPHA